MCVGKECPENDLIIIKQIDTPFARWIFLYFIENNLTLN